MKGKVFKRKHNELKNIAFISSGSISPRSEIKLFLLMYYIHYFNRISQGLKLGLDKCRADAA